MTDNRDDLDYRVRTVEGDLKDHSRIITELVQDGNKRNIADAVSLSENKQRDAAISKINAGVQWALRGVGTVAIAEIVRFIFNGGIHGL